ncbi:MAG: MBL fold metallo-hydrolase [Bdellovibrionales bacterium]|nr:MBL fold metallo-hydrolase [Bdellovibrionales bacterium]
MIQVKIFYAHNDLRNFSYLILDKNTGHSWVIDPYDEKPIIDYIKKESLTLSGILNTHHHWDHIRGNSALQTLFNCSVLTREENQVKVDSHHLIRFVDTPGHTKDHVAFYWQRGQDVLALFSGDTLFNSGVGNCKGGGSVEALYETTNRLKKLSDNVVLYPGHDYVLKNLLFAKSCEPENAEIDEALKMIRDADTEAGLAWTLGQEKKVNPFFRLNSAEMQEKIMQDEKELESEHALERNLFKKLRALRDNW